MDFGTLSLANVLGGAAAPPAVGGVLDAGVKASNAVPFDVQTAATNAGFPEIFGKATAVMVPPMAGLAPAGRGLLPGAIAPMPVNGAATAMIEIAFPWDMEEPTTPAADHPALDAPAEGEDDLQDVAAFGNDLPLVALPAIVPAAPLPVAKAVPDEIADRPAALDQPSGSANALTSAPQTTIGKDAVPMPTTGSMARPVAPSTVIINVPIPPNADAVPRPGLGAGQVERAGQPVPAAATAGASVHPAVGLNDKTVVLPLSPIVQILAPAAGSRPAMTVTGVVGSVTSRGALRTSSDSRADAPVAVPVPARFLAADDAARAEAMALARESARAEPQADSGPFAADGDGQGHAAMAPAQPTQAGEQLGSAAPAMAAKPQAAVNLSEPAGVEAMIDHIERLRDDADAQDTRIRLAPDRLGSVDIAIRRVGDVIHVRFAAEAPATRILLEVSAPRLAEAAEARGLVLGETTVAPAAMAQEAGADRQGGAQGGSQGSFPGSSHGQTGSQPQPGHSSQQAARNARAVSDDPRPEGRAGETTHGRAVRVA